MRTRSAERRAGAPAPRSPNLLAVFLVGFSLSACGSTNDKIAVPAEELDAGASCHGPLAASDGVVALYTFDADEGRAQVADFVGGQNGSVQLGLATTVAGPSGCNRAFSFGANGQYIVIDDSPSWDMEVGSIDLWLRLPAELSGHVGVLSRDLDGRNQPGHLSLFVDNLGRAIVRIQPQRADFDNSTDAVSCSAGFLPRQTWVHLGVNFGSPAVELYVDGRLEQWTGTHAVTSDWLCGQPGAYGIAGNDLPWAIGRTTFQSPSALELLEYPASGCAIDHLRISSQRRDFSTLLQPSEG